MDQDQSVYDAWGKSNAFWAKLMHQQMEQSLKFWAMCGQAMPHKTARQLAAEAEAQKTDA
jgi:hypothetical protein